MTRGKRDETEDAVLLAHKLFEVGDQSVTKLESYTPSTIRVTLSNIRLLEHNGYKLSDEVLRNDTLNVLNRLHDTRRIPLKNEYKRQIYNTLRRIFGDTLNVNSGAVFGKRSKERDVYVRNFSHKFRDYITRVLRHCGELLTEFCTRTEGALSNPEGYDDFDVVAYEVCIAAYLSLVTCFHMAGLLKLKMEDIRRIERGESIIVKAKRKNKRRFVKTFDLTLQIVRVIILMRPRVEAILDARFRTNSRNIVGMANQQARITEKYVLIFGATTLYDGLRRISSDVPVDTSDFADSERRFFTASGALKSLGYNIFRKLMTTNLVESGYRDLAKRINLHNDAITTLRDYTMSDTKYALENLINQNLTTAGEDNDDSDDEDDVIVPFPYGSNYGDNPVLESMVKGTPQPPPPQSQPKLRRFTSFTNLKAKADEVNPFLLPTIQEASRESTQGSAQENFEGNVEEQSPKYMFNDGDSMDTGYDTHLS